MIATKKVLQRRSFLYLEALCPRCEMTIARVIELAESYPQSVLLWYDREDMQCDKCGAAVASAEVFGRAEFKHPDDMRKFFKRAWIVRVYEGGVLATTPASLDEAWQR